MLKHKKIVLFCVAVVLVLFTLTFFTAVHWTIFLLLFLVWLGLTAWGSFDIRLNYFTKAYSSKPNSTTKEIALTFDDGPHEMTEKVLDLLKKFNVKATFFCIGKQIENNPELFKRIISDGHLIGNHSYSHSENFGFFSSQKVVDEITKTNKLVEQLSGIKMNFFRPPFGVTNPMISKAVSETKHLVVGWNIRSLDTVYEDENTIFERVKNKIKPGGIILLHDTSQKSVNVLERLLLFLKSENYSIVAVDELLNLSAYEN
ncbi:polysaccharide deacetylase family protein [Flavobacterium azooxidireducens]|uniref:Polysaccharide deacetylase family protein n=1 Tax=Flavobacterium azooxidireducens TaxID=1871076 RepID=A0ABY4KI13_9FLAO|nr:polysaccharide deacetylase family protein [Flavobacterium azooxidireducens]UPQ79916.1 polysaccharide deacetylase family protein [Flavobacterium azooxidireducens]